MMSKAEREIRKGERFAFGENWGRFLNALNEERNVKAETSLKAILGIERLDGQFFLHAGSGSVLFGLAARRLGAHVVSFDFDPQSVACTQELRRRYFPGDGVWRNEQSSVLDNEYLTRLGQFDVANSWGVLRHTIAKWWPVLENVLPLDREAGAYSSPSKSTKATNPGARHRSSVTPNSTDGSGRFFWAMGWPTLEA
jgi:hypothetical protein